MVFKNINRDIPNVNDIDLENDLATTVETLSIDDHNFKIYTMENNSTDIPEYYIMICAVSYDNKPIEMVKPRMAKEILDRLKIRKLPIYIYKEDFLPQHISIPRNLANIFEAPIRVQ